MNPFYQILDRWKISPRGFFLVFFFFVFLIFFQAFLYGTFGWISPWLWPLFGAVSVSMVFSRFARLFFVLLIMEYYRPFHYQPYVRHFTVFSAGPGFVMVSEWRKEWLDDTDEDMNVYYISCWGFGGQGYGEEWRGLNRFASSRPVLFKNQDGFWRLRFSGEEVVFKISVNMKFENSKYKNIINFFSE